MSGRRRLNLEEIATLLVTNAEFTKALVADRDRLEKIVERVAGLRTYFESDGHGPAEIQHYGRLTDTLILEARAATE